jgi:BolA protein
MGINAEELQKRFEETLAATVEVVDESHLHAGHAGARAGGKHFRVKLKSPKFQGLSTLARHRLVYDAVADWMHKEIHALAIDATLVD